VKQFSIRIEEDEHWSTFCESVNNQLDRTHSRMGWEVMTSSRHYVSKLYSIHASFHWYRKRHNRSRSARAVVENKVTRFLWLLHSTVNIFQVEVIKFAFHTEKYSSESMRLIAEGRRTVVWHTLFTQKKSQC